MPAPVGLVTVHHEGAGAPTDSGRYAEGGYTYGIGVTYWTHFRDVWSSYATLNYNHVSLDLCLSGNRMEYPVYDKDIEIIRGAVTDARSRGYVIDAPEVRAHRNSPGSSTVCPGDHTMQRWADVVAACTAGGPPPPEVSEMQTATAVNEDGRAEVFSLNPAGDISHKWRNPDGTWSTWVQLAVGPFDSVSAFRNDSGTLEVVAHHTSRGYLHTWQTKPNNGWSDWTNL